MRHPVSRHRKLGIALLAVCFHPALATEFYTGQAARAVLGQKSFSSSQGTFSPSSMVFQKGRLYVADNFHQVWTFDLTKLPDVKESKPLNSGSQCAICLESPLALASQSVSAGTARMSSWGKVAAVVDHAKRRVLIWRDTTNPRSAKGPDVTLNREGQGSGLLSNPVSVAVDGKRLYVGDATLHQVLVWNTLPANDDQPPDAILGRAVTADSSSSDKSVRPDDISWPATLGSDGSNLFVGDPLTHRILVFSPADQRLDENSVSNSASFAHTPFAPGTLITLEGSGLSEVTESSNSTSGTPAPTMLGGTEVLLDGVALPIFSVLRGKLQSQIPYSIDGRTSGSLYLRTRHATGEVTATVPVVVEFASTSPGLFAFPGTEPRVGIALRSATEGEGQLASPVTPESKVQPGDVLTLWASGLGVVGGEDRVTGPRDSLEISSGEVLSPVRAEIDGQPVRVVSARLPDGAQGVYEVRIAMPATLKTSPAQLTIFQDGLNSNTITLPVQH